MEWETYRTWWAALTPELQAGLLEVTGVLSLELATAITIGGFMLIDAEQADGTTGYLMTTRMREFLDLHR